MKEIKFTTNYEPVLSFSDWNFKTKYEERVGNNPGYIQIVHGEAKHLALCPRCNNPVAILGVYKKINVAPIQRHEKESIFLMLCSMTNISFRSVLITINEQII